MEDREKILDTRPSGGDDNPLDITDLSGEVPDVDDALDAIDTALSRVEREQKKKSKRTWGIVWHETQGPCGVC